MAFSSYDWANRKRELCVLMEEYLQPGATARINVVPPSDNRLLSSVNIMSPDVLRKGWRRFLADPSCSEGAWNTQANLTVRAHLTRDDPHSFVALVLGANQVCIPSLFRPKQNLYLVGSHVLEAGAVFVKNPGFNVEKSVA